MKNKSVFIFLISIFISLAFVFIYIADNSKLKETDVSDAIKYNENIQMKIESINYVENYVEVTGWAIDKGKTYDYYNWVCGKGSGVYINNTIVLEDSNGTYFTINTTSCEKAGINEKINDGIDYRNCGIRASIKVSKLKKDETYKIGVIIRDIDGNESLAMSDKELHL